MDIWERERTCKPPESADFSVTAEPLPIAADVLLAEDVLVETWEYCCWEAQEMVKTGKAENYYHGNPQRILVLTLPLHSTPRKPCLRCWSLS